MSEAFDAGAAAGRDINKTAIDCPHLPTDISGARDEWLSGFSSTRGQVSSASDPEKMERVREPDGPTRVNGSSLHEG